MSERAGPRDNPSAARWAAIEAAFGEAESLPEARRAGFLASLARDDPELADEVRSLLGARDSWWLDQAIAKLPRAAQPEAERIGPYELVRPLGHGGMGEVWLAVREGTDFRQHVALKITRIGLESAELLAAFRAERQILASLNHPNIAHLLDVGEAAGGRPYLALEYVEGVPLTVYCDRHRLPVEPRIDLFRTVCDAVRYAHRNLVVHRDLKPSNILVTGDGTVKLLDFGTAKVLHAAPDAAGVPVTTPDQVLTPDYAAPEQLEGGAVTTASDIYSLGVVLYELLAGRRPYRMAGRSLAEMREMIRTVRPAPPSQVVRGESEDETQLTAAARSTTPEHLARRLGGDLDAIVLRAMEKDPEQRYSSVDELLADIDRAASGRPVSARPRTMSYVTSGFVRRHRLGVAVAAVAASVLAGFVVTLFRQAASIRERSVQVERERHRAEEVASFLRQLFRGADPAEARGATITARELLDRGAERVERELAGQPAVQADLMTAMSQIYQELGLYDPAERLARRALELVRARHVAPDSVLAAALVEHGKALHWQSKPKEAEAHYRDALALWRQLGKTGGALEAHTLTYLGSARQDQGDDSTAEQLYRQAIALERKGAASADTGLALSLNNLGVVLRRKGDLVGAEAAHREALAIRRRVLGSDHPDAIQSLNNVAIAVGSRGDLATAETLLLEVADRWRRVLGDTHPRVADALTNLGGLYLRKKEPARAIPFYAQAVAIRRERFGARSPEAAQSLFNLGVAYADSGNAAHARSLYNEALDIRAAALGADHPSVAAVRDAIAQLDAKQR